MEWVLGSGTGTNLKVGAHVQRKAPEKICRVPPFFVSTRTISPFCERFRDGSVQFGQFLFFDVLLTLPLCPGICKSAKKWGPVPRALPCGVGAGGVGNVTLNYHRDRK